jgi:uncharacterized protein (DUF1499 family)
VETPSSVATWSARIAWTGAGLFVGGPVLNHLGTPPMVGFGAFALGGLLLGLVALALGGVGLVLTRPASGRAGRGRAVLGALLGLALVGGTLGASTLTARSAGGSAALPQINDITTDPSDPPRFVAIAAATDRDLSYPGESFAEQQRAAYPDLAPIRSEEPLGAVYQRARATAAALGWEIVSEDPVGGRIEATDTTRVFRFVDDVVIRIRPGQGGGVVLDLRSKSRDGRGDLGANAVRIRAFRAAFEDYSA